MYIGTLSKQTNVSRKAIYLYESLGLIPTPVRRGRYRLYDATTADVIRIIKCAQALGFRLKELAEVLHGGGEAGSAPDVGRVLALIDGKRSALRRQIEDAERRIALLDDLAGRLAVAGTGWRCDPGA